LIWLTWRQSRLKAASATLVLAAFAILLAVTGPPLASLYSGSRIGSCQGSDCVGPADDFLQQLYGGSLSGASSVDHTGTYWLLYLLGIVTILVAPAVIGIFWGAPLIAGEFEAGTHYLAWNQSVTRTRWLAVKLTLTGLAAMAVTEALSLMQAWWATPIFRAVARGAVATPLAMNQFSPLVFATHGIAPLGYAAFAFALGVTVGVLVRRAVPAMALTLALFAVLQVVMPLWIRPQLFPPDHTVTTLASFGGIDVPLGNGTFTLIPSGWDSQPESWVLSSGAVNAAGEPVSALPAACMQVAGLQVTGGKANHPALLDCLASHGIRMAVTYQPASRYWAFQWTETAIYAALALALTGYCFWRIRRRL
jgi:ABC-type transport system involved in multi-copper enzyme maturation permease subunit